MELDFRQNKKKDKTKYSIINLDLFKPGKKKYPEFDYEEIRREHLNENDSSGDDERFHDREALEMVRRLEAKYGNKKTKKGKKIRFGGEDDFIDKTAGYDREDAFIDDSEAYDEMIPSSMDTQNGGFYVNKGLLEFKWRHEEIDDSDLSDTEMASTSEQKKAKKRPLTENTSVDQSTNQNENTSEAQTNVKLVPQKKSKITAIARLTGGPPTKRFAGGNQASPIQKAAQLIKKKRLAKIKPIATTLINSPSTSAEKTVNGSSCTTKMDAISQLPQLEPQPACSTTAEANITPSKATALCDTQGSIISTPVRKELPPLTDTLSQMLNNFKKVTERLAAPGQKKRLQTSHVDLVIGIEGQCMKDGFSSHEKSRVLQSVADYIGLHRSSLMLRVQRRKDEVAGKKASTSIGKPLVPENGTQPTPAATDSDIQVLDMVVAAKPAVAKEKVEGAQQFSNPEIEEAKKMVVQLQALGVANSEMTDLTTSLNIQQFRERFLLLIAKKAGGAGNLLGAPSAKKVSDFRPAVVTPKAAQTGAAVGRSIATAAVPTKMIMSPLKAAVATPPKITLGAPVVTINTNATMVNGNNAAVTKPKVTLGQYMAKEKIDNIPVPPALDTISSITALEREIASLQSVVHSAVTSSHTAFNLKVEDCKKSGKQAPIRVNFQFTESLHSALKSLMYRIWQVLSSREAQKGETPLNKAGIAAGVLESKVLPFFSEMIGIGRLCLEICRRNPDNYMILKAPKIVMALSKEHIDPTSSTIVGKRGVPRAGATNAVVPPNTAIDDNEIQFIDVCPSTSSKTHSASKQITSTEANISKVAADANEPPLISNAALSAQGIGSAQLAQMQLLLQAIALNGNDVTKLTANQQTMLLQLQQNMQGTSSAAATMQEKAAQALKEQKRLEKELERQKREESIAIKQRQIEEKKKRLEEEKRLKEKQKAEEKAKKQEEERLRKVKEKEEKELQARLAMEKRQKEEEERRLREEEIEQQALMKRIKQEEAEQRAREEKRLSAMRKEEEFAAILLQEENSIEDGEIPDEVIKAQEEELEAEEERIRGQREKAEAARAAAAQQVEVKPTPMPIIPLVPIGGASQMDDYMSDRMDVKPLPYQLNNDAGFTSPSPVGLPLRSPSFVGNVAASPLNNSPFAYPASQSSGSNVAPSPVQQAYQSAIRSPFTQQHQQSPCNASIQSPHTQQNQARSSCGMEQNMGTNNNNQQINNMMYSQQNATYPHGQNQFVAQQPVNVHFNAQQQNIQQQMMKNQINQRQIQNGYNANQQPVNEGNDARMAQQQYENQQMLMQRQAQQLQAQQMHQQQMMQQMQREQLMYNQQQSMNSQMNPHFTQQQNYNGRFM